MIHRAFGCLAALALLLGSLAPAVAQVARDGLYIAVGSPITTESALWVREVAEKARKDGVRPPAAIVFDFNPGDKDAVTPTLGGAADLAQFIVTISDIPTIAFVHGKVAGHAVLPALACRDLVMGKGATIGDILNGGPGLNQVQANAYDLMLRDRWPGRMPAIRKMADANLVLLNGKDKAGGSVIVEKGAIPAGVTVPDPTPIGFAPAGKIGVFTTKQAEDLGFVRTRAETVSELAEKFNLNPASLRPEAALDRPPLAFRYVLHGEITVGKKESLLRTVKDVIRQKATILFLQIECGGGDLNAARDLAVEMQKLQDGSLPPDETIKIVGFIPDRAPDTATVVAFGCADIVMSRRKDSPNASGEATIGDFDAYVAKGKPDAEQLMATTIGKLVENRFPELVARGMVDRGATILRVRSSKDADRRTLLTAEQFEAAKADWVQEKVVKPAGQLLVLTASEAEQLGVARFLVDGREIADVAAKYGFESGKLREATPGPLEKFGQFLRIPSVTVLLVLIGFTGLILELKVPGATVPGIVAALSFILLFWAHTQFSGQVAVLAGSIFVLGLVLILLEVFVIPGFGAPGVLGILFMLAGLALATMDSIPQTAAGWGQFGFRISQFLFTLFGAFALAFGVAKYFLPKIPFANKLLLPPPAEGVDAIAEIKETVAGAAQAYALLGAVGTTVTVLRPAGNVRFGDQFVDVVADGGYIPAGARVKVVLVEGNRIVVKEV
jgi:membrane-bound ClpP family serine protease